MSSEATISLSLVLAAALFTSCGKDAGNTGAGSEGATSEEVPRVLPVGTSEGPGLSRRALDVGVIEALVAAGADVSKAHRIEHHIVVENRDKAQQVVSWAAANEFEASLPEELEVEGGNYYTIDLVRERVLNIELINRDSKAMETLAMSLGSEYDGWGCSIVR